MPVPVYLGNGLEGLDAGFAQDLAISPPLQSSSPDGDINVHWRSSSLHAAQDSLASELAGALDSNFSTTIDDEQYPRDDSILAHSPEHSSFARVHKHGASLSQNSVGLQDVSVSEDATTMLELESGIQALESLASGLGNFSSYMANINDVQSSETEIQAESELGGFIKSIYA